MGDDGGVSVSQKDDDTDIITHTHHADGSKTTTIETDDLALAVKAQQQHKAYRQVGRALPCPGVQGRCVSRLSLSSTGAQLDHVRGLSGNQLPRLICQGLLKDLEASTEA